MFKKLNNTRLVQKHQTYISTLTSSYNVLVNSTFQLAVAWFLCDKKNNQWYTQRLWALLTNLKPMFVQADYTYSNELIALKAQHYV